MQQSATPATESPGYMIKILLHYSLVLSVHLHFRAVCKRVTYYIIIPTAKETTNSFYDAACLFAYDVTAAARPKHT